MNATFSDFQTFGNIITNLKSKERQSLSTNCLQTHSIDPSLRGRMVNWMVEVCSKFEFSSKVYFLSVKLMDKYLQLTFFPISPEKVHLIGVTCMFIASKFEDVSHLSLKLFINRIARDKFTPEDVTSQELEIIKTLNFDLDLVVCSDFLSLICKLYSIPRQVEQAAEDLLYVLQMIYDLQLMPSAETLFSIYFACFALNYEFNSEIFILLVGIDFKKKLSHCYTALRRNEDFISKFRNAQIYRKFELDSFNLKGRDLSVIE